MKIKGVSVFEQHVEKVLFLVVMVAFLGVLSVQFMTEPNGIDIGGRDKVAPKDIFRSLATQANRLDGQLVDVTPNFPEVSSVDLQASYEAMLSQPVAPTDRLAIAFGVPDQAIGDFGDTGGQLSSGPIAGLSVPALNGVYVSSDWVTIDPYELEQSPVLARFVTDRQPHDFASVSVQTLLDGSMLRGALSSAEDGFRPIPRKFWSRTGIAVMSVQVERERLGADQEWHADGDAVPMPGTIQPSWYVQDDATLADVTEMISNAKSVSDRVMQPGFPATISGPGWLPPVEAAQRVAKYANLGEFRRITARIEDYQEDIARLQGGGNRPTSQTNTPQLGQRNTQTTTRPNTGTGNTSRRDSQIQNKMDQIERAKKDLEELGFDTAGDDDASSNDPGSAFRGRFGSSTSFGSQGGSILDSDSVPVWTHDLGVEPGATYRYRIRVGVNNPLFGRAAQLEEGNAEHERLASEVIAYSPWTDWSEPVLVGARDYFFVTSASQSGGLRSSSPRASGELYTMHYGYYRKAQVSLTPGDPVLGEIKVPEGLVTFNTGAIDQGQAAEALAAYQKSLGREDDTGGFTARGNLNQGIGRDPVGQPFQPALAGQNDPASGDFDFPEGMAALEGRLATGIEMVLLDVSTLEIAGWEDEDTTRVYLGGAQGSIKVVIPSLKDTAFELVKQSNMLSEDAWIDFGSEDQARGASGNTSTGSNPFGPVPAEIWGGP